MDLTGKAYTNLPYRLRRQANNVEKDGWLNAARLMRNAADLLLANDVVVIPSPYNYVKNAATVVTEHMIDKLNELLVEANGQTALCVGNLDTTSFTPDGGAGVMDPNQVLSHYS